MALFLTEADVVDLLTMDNALDAVEEGFKSQADGKASNSPRSRLRLPGGVFNFMSAVAPGLGVLGLKAYSITRDSPAKFYVQLSSSKTGELLALIQASDLSQIRTGAATGIATRYMAREDASTVGIIGSGYQARTQLEAVCRVRDIRTVKVFSPTREHRERFAADMAARLIAGIRPVDTSEECARDSDVVVAITSSSTPVLDGEWISPGTHVNAAGANHWRRRELDDEAIKRSDVIVTDDLQQAMIECGDLINPVERGLLRWEQVRNLADVVAGSASGRNSDTDVTLFESQGIALEDIAVGIRVYEMALEKGIGQELPF